MEKSFITLGHVYQNAGEMLRKLVTNSSFIDLRKGGEYAHGVPTGR